MKKKILIILIIFLLPILIVIVFNKLGFVYGSMTDWITQHVVLPDYFRNLFYQTGDLFPNLALNIGGGQNIYNFAYYGFLNPIILLSYLLPFVKMTDYIAVTSLMSIFISTYLIYKWLKNNHFNQKLSIVISILFLLSGPMIFHSHRHIMFINYFPFLIMGLMGVDKYYNNKKSWLLIISVFLIIMTSYYYSICSLITLFIYNTYLYLKNNIFKFKNFLLFLIKSLFPYIIGILMAAIIIIPIFSVVLNGRGELQTDINYFSLLIPKIRPDNLLYDSYTLGLTSISIISLIYSFLTHKKENIFLSLFLIIMMIFPVFSYVLNGGLYIRGKVLIPLLPLCLLIIANYLNGDVKNKKIVIWVFILSLLFLLYGYNIYIYYFDVLILLFFIFKTKKNNIYIFIIIAALLNVVIQSSNEKFVKISDLNKYNNQEEEILIKETINTDNGFYRINNLNNTLQNINKIYDNNYYQTSLYSSTYNKDYYNLYYNTFNNAFPSRNSIMQESSSNILFQTFMGVKYIISNNIQPIGYELVDSINSTYLYKNSNTYPIGYVSSLSMGKNEYNKLPYPYNIDALMSRVIINDNTSENFTSNINPYQLSYKYKKDDNINVERDDLNYKITTLKESSLILNLNENLQNQVLIITFDLKPQSCKEGDLSIEINGVKNTLTCSDWLYKNNNTNFSYVISSNKDINDLNIIFGKGIFNISNIKTYTIDYKNIINNISNLDPFIVDLDKTKGDSIIGDVSAKKDGYFVLNIPYDKGYTILVNNNVTNYEKVNEGFIGFKLSKGDYHIKIKYEAPYKKLGLYTSSMGIVIYIIVIYLENRKSKKIYN